MIISVKISDMMRPANVDYKNEIICNLKIFVVGAA